MPDPTKQIGYVDRSQGLHSRCSTAILATELCPVCLSPTNATTHKLLFVSGGVWFEKKRFQTLIVYVCPDCTRPTDGDSLVRNIKRLLADFEFILVI